MTKCQLFDIGNDVRYYTYMAKEYNVDYIWDSLADFWKLFEDAPVVDQLWRGYVFTVNNLYYQLYQLNLSKCIHTIPYKWISDWEVFVFNDDTSIGYYDDNRVFNLNTKIILTEAEREVVTALGGNYMYPDYPYVFRLPYGVKNVTQLNESPRETVMLPNNTMLSPDNVLILPDNTERYLGDTIYYPEEVIEWDDYLVFPKGITVDTVKMFPNSDFIVNEVARTIHFKRKPYELMWSNLAIRDLEMIYDNFGVLLKYYKPDSYKYLREVQGLWFAYWNGAAVANIEIGLNILRDLPFVSEDGVVEKVSTVDSIATIGDNDVFVTKSQYELLTVGKEVSYVNAESGVIKVGQNYIRISPDDAANISVGDAIVDKKLPTVSIQISGSKYDFTGESTVSVSVGEFVPKFMPLTNAIGVYDYINYPGWWREYVGGYYDNFETCLNIGGAYFDTTFFDSGIFDAMDSNRCLEALFLQYFTFLVKIDSSAWFCSRADLEVVIAFLHAIKPAYTHFLFQFDLMLQDDTVTHDSEFRFKDWNYCPKDIPLDHHHFDMEVIHPNFDDGSYFDFDKERDYLCISVFGSPHIFEDDIVTGYTFDDIAVVDFDYHRVPWDSDPLSDGFYLDMTRKIPEDLNFVDKHTTLDK